MALFTDGTMSTIDELRAHDGAVLDLARGENLDLSEKLELAQEELGVQLTARFLNAAVRGSSPARRDLSNVVVTKPMSQWHIFHTLAIVYRDAYHSQYNDRYKAKWKEYTDLADWAMRMLFETGVGVVGEPVARALPPQLSTVEGALPATTHYCSVAWLNGRGQEGRPSEPAFLSTADGSLLEVATVNAPPNATGWNVYVGPSDSGMTRQNDGPLAVGEVWTETDSGLSAGTSLGNGQTPDSYLTIERILQRG